MAERHKKVTGRDSDSPFGAQDDPGARREPSYLVKPVETDRRIDERHAAERRRRIMARVRHFIDYLFFLLYGLIAVRFLLTLLGANEEVGFVQFIRRISEPFYGPFGGIISSPSIRGGEFDLAAVIAVLAYGLLHIAVRGLLRVLSGPPPAM